MPRSRQKRAASSLSRCGKNAETAVTASAFRAEIPFLCDIPVVGDILFSYGFLTYFAIIISMMLMALDKKNGYGLQKPNVKNN